MSDNVPPVQQRMRKRFEGTPPPVVAPPGSQLQQLETPQRSAIFAVLYYCEKKGIHCTLQDLQDTFNIPISTSSRVLASRRARRLGDSDQIETRGRDYIEEAPFEEKGDTWVDLAYHAGATSDKTQISARTIERRVGEVCDIHAFKAAKKELLKPYICAQRVDWCKLYKQLRPTGKDWRQVLWCDEIHNSSAVRHVKWIKRKKGERWNPSNIQYESYARPDPEEQARQRFHFFCVIGYNFAWCTPYNAGNSNGKMNAKTYIKILSKLQAHILGRELVLWQDCDSAHVSQKVLDWMDYNGMEYINSSPKYPDLSIMETWVGPLRRKFTRTRIATAEAGRKRFYKVFKELDQEKINKTIDAYPQRLDDCIKIYQGQMTKY